MKFAMGNETLSTLTKATSSSSEDLGALVKELLQAAEPLESKFRGAGRAAFDQFKARADEISGELNQSLGAVLQGIGGMNLAFTEGESQMVDQTQSIEGSSAFDAARFSAR